MAHSKPIANTATLVLEVSGQLHAALCDHQAFFVLVIDGHGGVMPAGEDMMKRSPAERKRAAEVLRMWAARIETGRAPEANKA